MQENYTVCNCKQVSYNDILAALQQIQHFEDVLSAFNEVQKITHCSTGCGGCHEKILGIISNAMYGYETAPEPLQTSCKR